MPLRASSIGVPWPTVEELRRSGLGSAVNNAPAIDSPRLRTERLGSHALECHRSGPTRLGMIVRLKHRVHSPFLRFAKALRLRQRRHYLVVDPYEVKVVW